MIDVYVKLCKSLQESFGTIGLSATMQKYFKFPETVDLLYVICVKLNSILLSPDTETDPVIKIVLEKLQSIMENPELLEIEETEESAEDLIKLLTTQQLTDCATTSVKYVNGELKYCVKQPIEEMLFAKQMMFDKHTTYQVPLEILKQLIKNQAKEETVNALKDRVKVLKKLASIASNMETPLGIVTIDRKNARLKTGINVESGVTQVLIN